MSKYRKLCYKLYWRIEGFIAPSLRYSQNYYEETLDFHVKSSVDWLDLGCGHQLLPPWRSEQEKNLIDKCRTIIGMDYSYDSLKNHRTIKNRIRGDIDSIPFKNESFDLVTANMVVEHLQSPERQFGEIHRVLKPGGLFIFHTPNASGYGTILARLIPEALKSRLACILEGRKEEDVFPTFYRANSKRRITYLSNLAGFDIEELRMAMSPAEFAIIPPLAILELMVIRILLMKPFDNFRQNIIAILRKPTEPPISLDGGMDVHR